MSIFVIRVFATKMRDLTQVQVAKVVTLIEEGRSYRYVARQMNVSPSVVSRVWNRYSETGSYVRRAGQGRKRVTTIQQTRFLGVVHLDDAHLLLET